MSLDPQDGGEGIIPDKAPPTRWYKKRAVLVSSAVLVVAAITVISDLPVHSSRASDIAAGQSVMSEINTDVASCAYAVKESFTIHADQVAGSLSSSDRHQAPSLLRDDLDACSFTDDSIFELSNIEVPGSAAGKRLGDVVNSVTLWATSDAIGAISDLATLLNHPDNQQALRDLGTRERALASDRADAFADISAADQILSAQLTVPALPALPDSPVTAG